MDKNKTLNFVESKWNDWYVKGLSDFIRVPNLSPSYDPEFLTNGKIEQAMKLIDDYIKLLDIKGTSRKVFQPKGSVPLVVYVIEPSSGVSTNVMLYGHLDKQPWMEGWDEGLEPTLPVIRGDYLYGRGGADDGYSAFSCALAVKAAQEQGAKNPRIALVLETEEESGSPNLVTLLNEAKNFIGKPDYMFCMDSGAFDYDSLWLTSSLRGVNEVKLTVECGKSGYHSGEVGGIVPETFRVVRQLLDRIDDSLTGNCSEEFNIAIPEWKQKEAEHMAKLCGDSMYKKYNVHEGVLCCSQDDLVQMYLNNGWRSNLSIIGADGLPKTSIAGNVVRSSTSLMLSLRLPPGLDCHKATDILIKKLTTNVPYNAKVTATGGDPGNGWCMKELKPWLDSALKQAGEDFFDGKPTASYGQGGSIPFLSELESMYPSTQIVALGVIGPHANPHAPNECINLPYAKKLTCALASVTNSPSVVFF